MSERQDGKRRPDRRSVCLVPALALVLGCLGCRARSESGAREAQETPERLYAQHCLGCHGAKGEGAMGSNIQSLNRSVEQIARVILDGQGKMPSFQGDLSEARMRAVAGYVKGFKFTK